MDQQIHQGLESMDLNDKRACMWHGWNLEQVIRSNEFSIIYACRSNGQMFDS